MIRWYVDKDGNISLQEYFDEFGWCDVSMVKDREFQDKEHEDKENIYTPPRYNVSQEELQNYIYEVKKEMSEDQIIRTIAKSLLHRKDDK